MEEEASLKQRNYFTQEQIHVPHATQKIKGYSFSLISSVSSFTHQMSWRKKKCNSFNA